MSRNKAGRRMEKATRKQYFLRSKFIHERLKATGLNALIQEVDSYKSGLRWNPRRLGIKPKAFEAIKSQGIKPHKVFAHPKIISDDTRLILYYRGIAGLPQKGMKELAVDTSKLEKGRAEIADEKALVICRALNAVLSAIIEDDPGYSLEDGLWMLIGTLAVSVDGSWRNAIGKGAADSVRGIIWDYVNGKGFAVDHGGKRLTVSMAAKQVRLKNACLITIGSDPDVAVSDSDGKLIVAIEIKGGLDPAGALERYGAVRKSFEKARKTNPRCHTLYLVSCITDGLDERVKDDGLVSDMRNLIDIIYDNREKMRFLKELFKYQVRVE